jgi:YidC/Oxa1 family membrane protein insertase
MDTKRMMLATLLSVGVVILYMMYVAPRPGTRRPPAPVAPRPKATAPVAPPVPVQAGVPPAASAFEATAAQAEEMLPLRGSSLAATLTNRGAALRTLVLTRFRAPAGTGDLVLLDEFESGRLSFQVHDRNAPAQPDLRQAVWEIVRAETTSTQAVFRYARADGIVFRKMIGLAEGDYHLRGTLTIENRNPEALVAVRPELSSVAGVEREGEGGLQYVQGIAGYEDKGRWKFRTGSGPSGVTDKREEIPAVEGTTRLRWLGTANKYFAALLIADPATWGDLLSFADYEGVVDSKAFATERDRRVRARGGMLPPDELAALRKEMARSVVGVFHFREFPMAPRASREFVWNVYAGPREPKTLQPFAASGLEVLVDYGFLSMRRLLLWLLLFFQGVTGNFGVAIILLTVSVRLCIFPLSRKAQVSMFKMQKLAPQLKALQEKFKEDRQRLTAETMKMYKENKVSPMGGCLPLLLQFPVFIGLYNTLLLSIELRQAPFVLWIRDLSEPDRLCPLPFSILGQTDLNLLPILMLVPMVVQSIITPKPADPAMAQQQKMMTWMMPLMFLFMCYTMPAGVSLYWFFSSLWGLAEIRLIKRLWLRDGPAAAVPSAPAGASPGR